MQVIKLPSGNVVPSLSEQKEYLVRKLGEWRLKYPKLYQPYLIQPRRLRRWNVARSGESAFRQDGSYKKKKQNTQHMDWRRKKGFKRDKAKRGYVFCKCKITDAREGHRRWQRDLLRKGLLDESYWEDLLSYKKDMFTSNWDCC